MTKFAAYLFDMDGLLLDTERLFCDIAVEMLVPHGFVPHEIKAHFLTLVGSSGAESTRKLSAFLAGKLDSAHFHNAWHDNLRQRLEDHVPLRPTVLTCLDHLAGQGARMAVVTSTHGHAARHHLKTAGLLHYFESVTGGDEVSATKPDPAPYREAAAGLGVDPRDCAAFEDSDPGTASATKAGCRVVQIPDLRPVDKPLPDLGQLIAGDLWAAVHAVGGNGPAATVSSSV